LPRLKNGPAALDRIIRSAIALFSRQGYYNTSTREIARLADLSEVTLFKYFDHKEDIFIAALKSSYQSLEPRLNALTRNAEGRTPEEVLPKIVGSLVDISIFLPELLKLVAVAILEFRGKYQDMCCRLLAPILTAIASYLRLNIERKKLRNLNPEIVAAAMALTIIVQPFLSRFIEGCQLSNMNGRETLDEFSSFWMDVLIAEPWNSGEPAEVTQLA
jgi:AcrR family transcriptional regulator